MFPPKSCLQEPLWFFWSLGVFFIKECNYWYFLTVKKIIIYLNLFSLSILIPSLVLGNPRYFCLGAWSGRRPRQRCSCTVEISWWCRASAACCTTLSPESCPTLRGQLCPRALTSLLLQTFLLAQSLSTALRRIGRCVPSTCSPPASTWLFDRCWLRVRNFQRNLGQMERAKHALKTVIMRTAKSKDINQTQSAETRRSYWHGPDRQSPYGIRNWCNTGKLLVCIVVNKLVQNKCSPSCCNK